MPGFHQPSPSWQNMHKKKLVVKHLGGKNDFMGMKVDAQMENKYFYVHHCLICSFIHDYFKSQRRKESQGQPLYAFVSCLQARALTPKCCFHNIFPVLKIPGAPSTTLFLSKRVIIK